MPMKPCNLTLIGKCTTCKKKYELTQAQANEAREMGCAFSPCCRAVATIEAARIMASAAAAKAAT